MHNVIVLGCGRSGTSMVAGSIATNGYWTGFQLWGPDSRNPKGYFEDPNLIKLNEALLSTAMESPLLTLGNNAPETLGSPNRRLWLGVLDPAIDLTPQPHLREKMLAYLVNTPYCLKDPQFSYSLGLWRPLFVDTRFVCVFRHPLQTAASMVKMCQSTRHYKPMNYSIGNALQVWSAMYSRILNNHSLTGNWLFLHYDQMFNKKCLENLEAFLDSPINRHFPDARLSSDYPTGQLPPVLAETYASLCERADYRSR